MPLYGQSSGSPRWFIQTGLGALSLFTQR